MSENILNIIIALTSVAFVGFVSATSGEPFTIYQAFLLTWLAVTALTLQDINRRKK